MECFIIIDDSFDSTRSISLHFENNSAEFTGSVMYGGQLDKCRLFFKNTTIKPDQCNCKPLDYSDNALETLMNMSTIVQQEFKYSILNISSPAKEIRFCEVHNRFFENNVYPGQHLDVPIIALGQAGYPVPTTIFWEIKNYNENVEYRLSPFSRAVESSCTNVTFQLYSTGFVNVEFKLYPENPRQNLIKGLTLRIHVLTCPIGFDLSYKDSRCACAKKLKKLTQNCYIDGDSKSIERMKNTFWIYKASRGMLILHEFRCPLDYCTNDPLNIILNDPSVQCEHNRN